MSPEFQEAKDPRLTEPTAKLPIDLSVVRSGVEEFFREFYDSDRNPGHSERVLTILKEFGHDTEGLEMASLLHDVVDHGIVNPKSDELSENAIALIHGLHEEVEDKNMFLYAVGSAISASNWESEVAEAWRVSALREVSARQEERGDLDSAILLGAISKSGSILDNFPSDIVGSVLESNRLFDLDTEKLRGAMTKLDVEGLLIKAAEIMDNLEYPPPDNPASTWRDCIEIFNCYGPALDLFGFKDLASELRGRALEFFYDDPDGKAIHQRQMSENYFNDVEAQLERGIEASASAGKEFKLLPLSIKSEGSIRQKLHDKNYQDIDSVPDGLRSRIIVPNDMSEDDLEALAREIQESILYTSSDVDAGHPRGEEEPFEVRKKEGVGYSAIHLTFIYHTPDGPVPYELQFATKEQDRIHEVGKASHILFKGGITEPLENVTRDMEHIAARAHFLQDQAIKPELNPNTWAQIIKYLPDMDTPLHRAFVLNRSAEGKTVLVPPRLGSLNLSKLTDNIETESELDAVFLPPDKLEIEHFFELISFIDPDLGSDPGIIEAVKLLKGLPLKRRKDGAPTLEGHLLPTAVNAAILATISGEHLEGEELPSEFLSKTIIAALLHDVIEDTRKHKRKITREEITERFGREIGDTVWALSTFDEIDSEHKRRQAYAEKIADDPKAKLIKLSDRMQNHQTDIVRLAQGVDDKTKEKIFEYFKKTDDYLTEIFDTLPQEYRRVRDMVWNIAKDFGYEYEKTDT